MMITVLFEACGIQLWVFEFDVLLEGALAAVVPATTLNVAVVLAFDFFCGSPDSLFSVRVQFPRLLFLFFLCFFLY